jgi:hypothetical protein
LDRTGPNTIHDAEVLAVRGGIDEATGRPVVCLTLRRVAGSGWGHINYSLAVDNAVSLLKRLELVVRSSQPTDVKLAAER